MTEFKSFYKTVQGGEGDRCSYPTRLDTYGCGCAHNCEYCYARSLLAFRGLWNPHDPAVSDIVKIRRKLDKIPAGQVLRLGGMTDCFQPCEALQGVTHKTLKLLNARGIGYLIVTKSALVASDKYMDVLDKGLAHIQISITATDDAVADQYEKASPISDRIKAIERLYDAGYDVQIRLSPYVPQFVEPLDRKLALLAGIKNKQVTVCEDATDHYEYFKNNFNPNPNDCCNLRRTDADS